MHLHHPGPSGLSALDVNGKYRMDTIVVEDLIAEGATWGLPHRRARSIVTRTVDELSSAPSNLDRSRYPTVVPAAISTVRDRLTTATRDLGPAS
jgi:serine/threonine-protein kinase HipA